MDRKRNGPQRFNIRILLHTHRPKILHLKRMTCPL